VDRDAGVWFVAGCSPRFESMGVGIYVSLFICAGLLQLLSLSSERESNPGENRQILRIFNSTEVGWFRGCGKRGVGVCKWLGFMGLWGLIVDNNSLPVASVNDASFFESCANQRNRSFGDCFYFLDESNRVLI